MNVVSPVTTLQTLRPKVLLDNFPVCQIFLQISHLVAGEDNNTFDLLEMLG